MGYQQFKVLKRSFRDRWTRSVAWEIPEKNDKRNQSIWYWCEVNQIDTIIEEIIEKEAAAVNTGGKGKKKVKEEKKAAEEIRKKALKRWGESSKRGGADGEVEVMKKREIVVAKPWGFSEKKQS